MTKAIPRWLSMLCLLVDLARAAPSEEELFFKGTADVNEGQLHFLDVVPDKPLYHFRNRVTVSDSSLVDGWVGIQQCHENLDEYQEWFVSSCIRAMNEYRRHHEGTGREVESIFRQNEYAPVRCVGTTFETRPDWCGEEEINRMLFLGVTKVELGVQHLDDEILAFNRRGCTTKDAARANQLLRDAGLKVGFHIMPNLPGSTPDRDRWLFEELFTNPAFRPDFLKIYPTLVTPGSEIEQLWKNGQYVPYDEDALIDLVAYGKSLIPPYVRLQRIQRDILQAWALLPLPMQPLSPEPAALPSRPLQHKPRLILSARSDG